MRTLFLTYDCNGVSDQNSYEQKPADGMTLDQTNFIVLIVPIRLEFEGHEILKKPHISSTK